MNNYIAFEHPQTFGVPIQIVDNYINAPEIELKLILFLLRNSNSRIETLSLCELLKTDTDRLKQAFNYWVTCGFLYEIGDHYSLQKPIITSSDMPVYSPKELSDRINSQVELSFLMKTAEDLLAKPLNTTECNILYTLVEWYKLPVEVILTIIKYCTENKKGLKAIQTMAGTWYEKEINTIEKAEIYLLEEKTRKESIQRISNKLGITNRALSDGEKKIFNIWINELNYETDIIGQAYENTITSIGRYSYQYINKILQEWHNKGYKTLKDILTETKTDIPTVKQSKNKKNFVSKTQIDLKQAEQDDWEIIENTIG